MGNLDEASKPLAVLSYFACFGGRWMRRAGYSPKPQFISVADGRGPLTAVPHATPTAKASDAPASPPPQAAAASPEKKDYRYFVEFRSRYALSYGHSYVMFGRVSFAPCGQIR